MKRASAKSKDAPVRALRSLREAVKFLAGQGIKCGKSTLADAEKAGRIVRTPDGGFDPASLLRWAAATVETGAEPDDLRREKLVAIVRGLVAKADREEFRRDREKGRLLDVAEARLAWGRTLEAARAKFLALPTRTAPLVFSCSTIEECRQVLDDAVREIMEELSSPTFTNRVLPELEEAENDRV